MRGEEDLGALVDMQPNKSWQSSAVTKNSAMLAEQINRRILSRSKEVILLWDAASRAGMHI